MKWTVAVTSLATAIVLAAAGPANAVTGNATYYNVGDEECGKSYTDSDLVVALSSSIFVAANCGRHIKVTSGKGHTDVVVAGVCPACAANDIDLSPAAFERLGSLDAGLISVEWHFV
ncbi:RlpA-like double-psi beta-barrel domain-containing protein [Nocardia australiensis]|uniref:RlpA-like double-psi beta-barrel domain-containing protein n=1 Tax=Nocardia australiensis TaxID=2887191 RepID=UPI001D14C4A3|nr:RlpA-like double-psi beta-barrel domain-containing protein [Nocardia australiensis]